VRVSYSKNIYTNTPLSQTIENDMRILEDSLKIINTSKNVETVINRFDDLVSALERLTQYENSPYVKFPNELPSQALIRMHDEKQDIINRATMRTRYAPTQKTKKKRTSPSAAIDYDAAQHYYNLLNSMKRLKKLANETKDYTAYFATGEESLLYLDWMKRDVAPPAIPCIQELPHIYCVCNRWDDAIRVHGVALEKGLIDKFQYDEAIIDIRNKELTHREAIEFIKNNPGVLQRDIYKKLLSVEKDYLKWVMRYSRDIGKVKSGNTYELYIG
jgi:hypothetical protein